MSSCENSTHFLHKTDDKETMNPSHQSSSEDCSVSVTQTQSFSTVSSIPDNTSVDMDEDEDIIQVEINGVEIPWKLSSDKSNEKNSDKIPKAAFKKTMVFPIFVNGFGVLFWFINWISFITLTLLTTLTILWFFLFLKPTIDNEENDTDQNEFKFKQKISSWSFGFLKGLSKFRLLAFLKKFIPVKPGESARVSDQGNDVTCSRHALGKAIVDGFENGAFELDDSLDFNQDEIIQKLIGRDKTKKWPIEFNDAKLSSCFEKNSKQHWDIKLKIKRVIENKSKEEVKKEKPKDIELRRRNFNEFINKMTQKIQMPQTYRYVLTYRFNPSKEDSPLHSVYIHKLINIQDAQDVDFDHMVCINSYGPSEGPNKDEYLNKKIKQEGNVICQVLCTASKSSSPSQPPTPIKNEIGRQSSDSQNAAAKNMEEKEEKQNNKGGLVSSVMNTVRKGWRLFTSPESGVQTG